MRILKLNRFPLAGIFGLFAAIGFVSTARADSNSGLSAGSFIAGADMSGVKFFEDHGKRYRDGGREMDPFLILKNHGVNFIRLRLFTSSEEQAKRDPYDMGTNLAYTLPLAQRVVKAGLPWMLDFHYSDTWADPGHQGKPAAWEGLSFDELEKRMYEHNRDSIAAFAKADAMPNYVQVGNEITSGMVWPDAKTDSPQHWEQLGRLMKAAIRGIRDASGDRMPKIVVHIDRGPSWGVVQWFFDHLKEQNVPFDIMGLSYYPTKSSQFDEIRDSLNKAADRYGHPIFLAETAFPFYQYDNNQDQPTLIDGIAPSPQGQKKFIQSLCKIVKTTHGGKGLGIFWWGTEYQPTPHVNLGGYDNSSMFDHDGNALPALEAYGRFGSLKWVR